MRNPELRRSNIINRYSLITNDIAYKYFREELDRAMFQIQCEVMDEEGDIDIEYIVYLCEMLEERKKALDKLVDYKEKEVEDMFATLDTEDTLDTDTEMVNDLYRTEREIEDNLVSRENLESFKEITAEEIKALFE